MTILQAAAAIRQGTISSRALTEQCLARIRELQPNLNAFITVLEDEALNQAEARDREMQGGIDRGPLHGIPIALKDVFETKGIRTTCGSKLFEHHVPERDSAVTERLAAAGSVLLGKTGMHELAYGITSNNPHFGTIRNPWHRDHVPGGSSGGSGAAVATSMCYMAMGSDTGGSIRIPAAFCGTVGLKPTYGRVSRYGVMPLDFSLDHMGPLTRSVRDAATVLQVLAGHDERDHTCSNRPVDHYLPTETSSLTGIRIGVPENFYFDSIHPGVAAAAMAMAKTAEKLGAALISVRVPDIAGLNAISRIILFAEATATVEPYLNRRSEFGSDILALFDQGKYIPATEYVQAQRLRRMFQQDFARILGTVDCLLTPTTPNLAPKIGENLVRFGQQEEDARLASTRFVRGINMLGLPALAIPSGLADGLPVSTQLVGDAFDEALILRIGAAMEEANEHHLLTPPGL